MALLTLAPRGAVRASTLLVALFLGTLLAKQAPAQQYKSIPSKTQPAQAKAMAPKVATLFRQGGALSDADKATLNEFFTYYFSAMTSPAPERLGQLAKLRKNLFQLYLNVPNATPEAREFVIDLSIKAAKAIAKKPNLHPAVRYNAALVLGQLDKTPGRTGAGAAPPAPLPAATAALVELLDAAAADPQAIVPPVVVGALVGLERHTKLGADPALAEKITNAALAVAASQDPPEGVSDAVHSWTKALAGRILANQSTQGLAPPTHQALVALVKDEDMILDDRCQVADAITSPMYKQAQGVNIDEMVLALGLLTRDILADEIKKAEGYLRKSGIGDSAANMGAFAAPMPGAGFGGAMGGMGGEFGMSGGGFGGGLAALDDTTPRYEKRRMLSRILAIRSAADALAAAGSPELKTRLEAITKPIRIVADDAVKPKATDAGVVEAVLDLADELNRVVATWGAAPADAAPADDPALPADAPAAEPPIEAAAGL